MHEILPRRRLLRLVTQALARSRVVALLGPRQCGKTTLARAVVQLRAGPLTWFDLENPRHAQQLLQPLLALEPLRGLVVLDEVQRLPELFPILRVLADRVDLPTKFLLLGSAAPDLLRRASESLAGRIEFVELGGLSLWEAKKPRRLWLRGGLPPAFLASSSMASVRWRDAFVQTFLERDLGLLNTQLTAPLMRRFWTMLAHYHAQTYNAAALAESLGISQRAVRHSLNLLTGTYMVRQLQPWFTNTKKRLVKTPKIYLRDSGMLHTLLGIETYAQLISHPQLGASWEGFALEQVLKVLAGEPYFWGTHNGAEVDLLLKRRRQAWGFEFKRADAPQLTRSMRAGLSDLQLEHLWVVYPGPNRYQLDTKVTVLPLHEIPLLGAPGAL